MSEIDIESYLKTLTGEIMRVNAGRGNVRLAVLACNVKLGLDTALPCGLIVTELVTNSLKYGFPDARSGNVTVSVNKTSEGEYCLIVSDDGVGIPAGIDITKSKSLGLRLVTMLSSQLNGELSITNQNGTRTELRFKESKYKNRI